MILTDKNLEIWSLAACQFCSAQSILLVFLLKSRRFSQFRKEHCLGLIYQRSSHLPFFQPQGLSSSYLCSPLVASVDSATYYRGNTYPAYSHPIGDPRLALILELLQLLLRVVERSTNANGLRSELASIEILWGENLRSHNRVRKLSLDMLDNLIRMQVNLDRSQWSAQVCQFDVHGWVRGCGEVERLSEFHPTNGDIKRSETARSTMGFLVQDPDNGRISEYMLPESWFRSI